MDDLARRFLAPENSTHRKYEALRAHYVERLPLDEAARRFGYAAGTLRNLRARFREAPDAPFFLPDRRGRRRRRPGPDRDRRIVELRTGDHLSAEEIAERLTTREHLPVSRHHRRPRAPARRHPQAVAAHARTAGRRTPAAAADRRRLDLAPRRLRTDFGGCSCSPPTSPGSTSTACSPATACPAATPSRPAARCAPCSPSSCGASAGRRTSCPETLDEGLALFAGLNTVPKRSTLAEYTGRVDLRAGPALMDDWHAAVRTLGVPLGGRPVLRPRLPYHPAPRP